MPHGAPPPFAPIVPFLPNPCVKRTSNERQKRKAPTRHNTA
uniref:Uncharacterized protein n=1 Tax=Myoviridae sp. ctqYq4 TaxID=2826702 RepID=A0A8S5LW93_9CAUD|nr:MAG TPA: hypothetical protein [Myoviridae sp. ctqYq4]DAI02595.1 MAG TPA: hypothetical protein [Caudoviricetes sp.]